MSSTRSVLAEIMLRFGAVPRLNLSHSLGFAVTGAVQSRYRKH